MKEIRNQPVKVWGLSADQMTELEYRIERAVPAHFAGVWEPDEELFGILLFVDEITLLHLLSRKKMLELAQQLTDLATGRVTNRQ